VLIKKAIWNFQMAFLFAHPNPDPPQAENQKGIKCKEITSKRLKETVHGK